MTTGPAPVIVSVLPLMVAAPLTTSKERVAPDGRVLR